MSLERFSDGLCLYLITESVYGYVYAHNIHILNRSCSKESEYHI